MNAITILPTVERKYLVHVFEVLIVPFYLWSEALKRELPLVRLMYARSVVL